MNGKYKYQLCFDDKDKRMMTDDTYIDVTKEDVSRLLRKLKQKQKPQAFIQAMRKKYDMYIDDTEKRIRQEFGLDYEKDGSIVSVTQGCYVNGYTLNQWRLLHVEDYTPPSLQSVTSTISSLERKGDNEAAELLRQKYKSLLEQLDIYNHARLGIPKDIPITHYQNKQIDGLPIKEWRAINDPSFVPSKQLITHIINKYSKLNDVNTLNIICQKYSNIIDSESNEPEISLEEAENFFAQLLGDIYPNIQTEKTNG